MQSFLFAMESIGCAYIIMVHDQRFRPSGTIGNHSSGEVVLCWRRRGRKMLYYKDENVGGE